MKRKVSLRRRKADAGHVYFGVFCSGNGFCPENMAAQQISVRSQSGEATEITKLESVLNVEQNGQDEIFSVSR